MIIVTRPEHHFAFIFISRQLYANRAQVFRKMFRLNNFGQYRPESFYSFRQKWCAIPFIISFFLSQKFAWTIWAGNPASHYRRQLSNGRLDQVRWQTILDYSQSSRGREGRRRSTAISMMIRNYPARRERESACGIPKRSSPQTSTKRFLLFIRCIFLYFYNIL